MTDNLNAKIFAHAKGALQDGSSETSEQKYNELIDELETLFGKNHKEVAAELQRIAKAIEDEGDPEASFTFKQRTCEVMLKRNMEQRRLDRAARGETTPRPPAEAAPPTVRRTLSGCEFICIPTHNLAETAEFYTKTLHATRVFEHLAGTRVVGLKVMPGPILLIIDTKLLEETQPAFVVEDLTTVLKQFEEDGINMASEPILTGIGTLYSFHDNAGNHFSLIDKKRVI